MQENLDWESSPKAQKGRIGEELVKRELEKRGFVVDFYERNANGSSVVDFICRQKNFPRATELAEVKVKTALNYGYGRFPVYTLPASQVEVYKKYSREKNLLFLLYFVDEERGGIFFQNLDALEKPFRLEGKNFPFDKQMFDGVYRCYSVAQFKELAQLSDSDIQRLKAIKFPREENSEVERAEEKLQPVKIKAELTKTFEISPNGTKINFYKDTDKNFYVRLSHFSDAVGYKGANTINTELAKAIVQTGVTIFNAASETSTKNLPVINVNDVIPVLERFIFLTQKSTGSKVQRRTLAENLIPFWKNKILPRFNAAAPAKIESPSIQKPLPKVEQISLFSEKTLNARYILTDEDLRDITKQAAYLIYVLKQAKVDAIKSAVEIKAREIHRDLTPLWELLEIALV